jgi:hypothetical protein
MMRRCCVRCASEPAAKNPHAIDANLAAEALLLVGVRDLEVRAYLETRM